MKELQQMDQRTRKLMTMHKALHLRDNTDRLCVTKTRKKRTHLHQYKDYIKKSKERLIAVTRNSVENIKINKTTITRKQK